MRWLVAAEHPVVALEAYNSTNLLGMCDPVDALEAYSSTNLLEMCAPGGALEAYSPTNLLEMCGQLDLLGEHNYLEEEALAFQLVLLAISAKHVNFEKEE